MRDQPRSPFLDHTVLRHARDIVEPDQDERRPAPVEERISSDERLSNPQSTIEDGFSEISLSSVTTLSEYDHLMRSEDARTRNAGNTPKLQRARNCNVSGLRLSWEDDPSSSSSSPARSLVPTVLIVKSPEISDCVSYSTRHGHGHDPGIVVSESSGTEHASLKERYRRSRGVRLTSASLAMTGEEVTSFLESSRTAPERGRARKKDEGFVSHLIGSLLLLMLAVAGITIGATVLAWGAQPLIARTSSTSTTTKLQSGMQSPLLNKLLNRSTIGPTKPQLQDSFLVILISVGCLAVVLSSCLLAYIIHRSRSCISVLFRPLIAVVRSIHADFTH